MMKRDQFNRTLYAGEVAIPRRRSKKRGTKLPWAMRYEHVRRAEEFLKIALDDAKLADAPLLAGKIRAAIKSAGGAVRHASGREFREHYAIKRAENEAFDRGVALAVGTSGKREVT